ncbi:MAG: Replication initiation and membrane attachment [Firmicutes bacterium ADurb.Bin300]|nr:MAG: Replication initiation and membrane attachment [Firmicutes bacterium ADurb.Bin300]HOD02552.1 DnaD domain protein [Clostridiales bacterium]
MYRFNPDCWGGCVAVPDSILEKYLKLASGACFKVLLYLLKNDPPESASAIAVATGLSDDTVADALLYWERENILIPFSANSLKKPEVKKDDSRQQSQQSSLKEKAIERPAPLLPIKPPTHTEIAKRLSESDELNFIFSEAQNVLCNTFGYNTQAILLMIYDYFGFSSDVILMLVQHAKLLGNTSSLGIKKLAETWAKQGVSTLSDAEKEIGRHNKALDTYSILSKKFDFGSATPNDTQARYLHSWLENFEFDAGVISLAFEKADCQGAKNSFSHANKTLRQWYYKGYRNAETISAKVFPSGKFNKGEPERSYDKVKMARSVIYDWINKPEGGNVE